MGKQCKQGQTIFLGFKITSDGDRSHEIKRRLLLGRKAMTNLDRDIRKQKHYFVNKGLSIKRHGFSSNHVCMWELDYKESWVPKKWCFCTVELEKTLESPLDCKEIKPVILKENQSWIFIGRSGAEAPILWPLDAKNQVIGKDPDAGKDWKQWQTIFLGFKITADSDCSHEIKRHLLLGRKAMTNLDRYIICQQRYV